MAGNLYANFARFGFLWAWVDFFFILHCVRCTSIGALSFSLALAWIHALLRFFCCHYSQWIYMRCRGEFRIHAERPALLFYNFCVLASCVASPSLFLFLNPSRPLSPFYLSRSLSPLSVSLCFLLVFPLFLMHYYH